MKNRALGLVIILLLMMCDIPASESDDDTYHLYKKYRDELYTLQKYTQHSCYLILILDNMFITTWMGERSGQYL